MSTPVDRGRDTEVQRNSGRDLTDKLVQQLLQQAQRLLLSCSCY